MSWQSTLLLRMVCVLHFFDAATARGITAAITRAIAPGSYILYLGGVR